jgi:hypothetical protein
LGNSVPECARRARKSASAMSAEKQSGELDQKAEDDKPDANMKSP